MVIQQNPGMFDSQELQEAERFFEWALSYERKGLAIAAEALREEGRKALESFLARSAAS
jgi:hypothetical protein